MKIPTLICVLLLIASGASAAERIASHTFDALEFRYLAPPGNKTLTVSGVPGDPNVVYAGTPSGGLFKSIDAGFHWKPVFDSPDGIASIGAVVVAPSNPRVVWLGTGEGALRDNIAMGDGVYRSTDAGATWVHVGLDSAGHIARIAVDPKDADTAYVAVEGRGYGPQKERGIFRTRDGGKSWERVLFVDENTGAADVMVDPSDPRTIFAATWQFSMGPNGIEAGGPGSGVYRSRDGGFTWQRLSNGLPAGALGRIGLAMSASNPRRIYAVISTPQKGAGSLWVSDDGGDTWAVRNKSDRLNSRAAYFGRVAAFPDNADEVYFLSQSTYVSRDGGATIKMDGRIFPDGHDIWIDPTNPSRVVLAYDRYVYLSDNRGLSWRTVDLPNAQIYRVDVDRQVPYNVYGNRHDGSGYKGPSNNRVRPELGDAPDLMGRAGVGETISNPITSEDWSALYTAEIGVSQPDPFDDNYVWLLNPYDLQLLDQRSGYRREVAPWPAFSYADREASRFRVSGFAISPSVHQAHKIYVGTQYVHVSYDMGATWQTISPDLTANSLKYPGTAWPEAAIRSSLQSLAESPVVPGVVWAGSNDGLIHVTRDDGKTWSDVTRNLPKLGPTGVVTSIEPSHGAAGKAYVTIDRHRLDDDAPYVFRTTDFGASWKLITTGIPQSVVSHARVIKEDPRRPGLLYLGTQGGLYLSPDDGETWTPLNSQLPRVPISWITIQKDYNDLVVSTFGRGIWTMDDVGPIQEFTAAVANSPVHLFSVRPTYLLNLVPHGGGAHALKAPLDPPSNIGENPPQGAPITYYVKSEIGSPAYIQITDAKGAVVRNLEGSGAPGIHRIWWAADRDSDKGRPISQRELVQPGLYKVKLTAGGAEQQTSVVLMEDPIGPRHTSPLDEGTNEEEE